MVLGDTLVELTGSSQGSFLHLSTIVKLQKINQEMFISHGRSTDETSLSSPKPVGLFVELGDDEFKLVFLTVA